MELGLGGHGALTPDCVPCAMIGAMVARAMGLTRVRRVLAGYSHRPRPWGRCPHRDWGPPSWLSPGQWGGGYEAHGAQGRETLAVEHMAAEHMAVEHMAAEHMTSPPHQEEEEEEEEDAQCDKWG